MRRGGGPQALVLNRRVAADQPLQQQPLLRAKVAQQRLLGDACACCQRLERGLLPAARVELLIGCIEQRFLRALLALSACALVVWASVAHAQSCNASDAGTDAAK